jgi:DNA-binding MarR family transcriptional regulator
MTARELPKSGPLARANGTEGFRPSEAPGALPGAAVSVGGPSETKGKLGAQLYDFAPIPTRALRDEQLLAEHFRLLGIIARHDGFGRNGTGCYASVKTLAAEIGMSEAGARALEADLIAMQYVHERPHPTRSGLRVLHVMYTEEDRAVMRTRRARPGVAADLPRELARALRSPVR